MGPPRHLTDRMREITQRCEGFLLLRAAGALVAKSVSRRTPDMNAEGPISTIPNPVTATPPAMTSATKRIGRPTRQAAPLAMIATPLAMTAAQLSTCRLASNATPSPTTIAPSQMTTAPSSVCRMTSNAIPSPMTAIPLMMTAV